MHVGSMRILRNWIHKNAPDDVPDFISAARNILGSVYTFTRFIEIQS